jgi:hypothetical protein
MTFQVGRCTLQVQCVTWRVPTWEMPTWEMPTCEVPTWEVQLGRCLLVRCSLVDAYLEGRAHEIALAAGASSAAGSVHTRNLAHMLEMDGVRDGAGRVPHCPVLSSETLRRCSGCGGRDTTGQNFWQNFLEKHPTYPASISRMFS